jgi:Predicted nucleic acid-binding protein, contains PIN domain
MVRPKPDPGVVQWVATTDESLLYLSVVTLGEIRKGISFRPDAARRAHLEAWLRALADRFSPRILPIDLAVADRWGHLAGTCKMKGLTLPVLDGLLAATALHYDLTLVTRNVKNVQGTGVDTLDPWNL